jgi:hypothetical protein
MMLSIAALALSCAIRQAAPGHAGCVPYVTFKGFDKQVAKREDPDLAALMEVRLRPLVRATDGPLVLQFDLT